MAWKTPENKKDVCVDCGHLRLYHSQFENSLGNNGHSCDYTMRKGKAVFRCTCRRFDKE